MNTIEIKKQTTSKDWLLTEYQQRKLKNRHFSIRSFARMLDLHPGRVSELLSGKRKITIFLANKIASSLQYSDDRRREFVTLIELESSILKDPYHFLKNWKYYAIVNLIQDEKSFPNEEVLAQRLCIKTEEVKNILKEILKDQTIKPIVQEMII
jgi:plasmid maintenance system antidote protein VapI